MRPCLPPSFSLPPRLRSWITFVGQLRKSCLLPRSCLFSCSTCSEIRLFFFFFFFIFRERERIFDGRIIFWKIRRWRKGDDRRMNLRLGTHLRANVFVERVRVDNDDNTGVTRFKEKYRNDAVIEANLYIFKSVQSRDNLQRKWSIVRGFWKWFSIRLDEQNNSCTFCKTRNPKETIIIHS